MTMLELSSPFVAWEKCVAPKVSDANGKVGCEGAYGVVARLASTQPAHRSKGSRQGAQLAHDQQAVSTATHSQHAPWSARGRHTDRERHSFSISPVKGPQAWHCLMSGQQPASTLVAHGQHTAAKRVTRPRDPGGVAALMSAHSTTPYITPSMGFSSGGGVVRGRRMQQQTFA